MQRAIISGITGHLGRELASQLVAAGIETHGLTRQMNLPRTCGPVQFHHIDGSTERLVELLTSLQPDTVFHIAALARREHQITDVEPFVRANVLLGTQLLEAMRHCNCRRIVTAGSYLQHHGTDGYRAFNLYAATKQAFETLLEYYVDKYGLQGLRLTLSDIYSTHDTRRNLMTDIARAWKTHDCITLQAEEAWVDLVHIEDAAAAFVHAARLLPVDTDHVAAIHRYSVTSGYRISATELVAIFERLGGGKLMIRRGNGKSSSHESQFGHGVILPGWGPKVAIEEGIMRIIDQERRKRSAADSV